MPQRAGEGDEGAEAEMVSADLDEESAPAADDPGSLDGLLAATDQGWDVEAQVLTLQQAAATTLARDNGQVSRDMARDLSPHPPAAPRPSSPSSRPSRGPPPLPRKGPPPLPVSPTPPPARGQTDWLHPDSLVDLLQARAAALATGEDAVGLARTQIELAIASETILGDDARAAAHASAALRADAAAPAAHALLRRTLHADGTSPASPGRGRNLRDALPTMLEHLEHELPAAAT